MTTVHRPISAVLHDILGNVQDIVRSEVRLAKVELREEMTKSRSAAVQIAVGMLMLILCVLFMLLAVVLALTIVMPGWAAALTVGTAVGAIAGWCLGRGVRKFKAIRAAPKTAASIKENVEWAKQVTR